MLRSHLGTEPLSRRCRATASAALLYLAALPAVVLAAPSGLNLIPTADVYDAGVPSLEYQSEGEGALALFGRDCGSYALLQLGVARGLEVGMDRCVTDDDPPFFNAKFRFVAGEGSRPALALGVQNVSEGQVAQPYVVAGWGFGRPLRAHLGVVTSEGEQRPMLGTDYTWRSLTLQADWIAGSENAAGIGVSWAPHSSVTATYSLLLPNDGGGANSHVLNVQYLARLW